MKASIYGMEFTMCDAYIDQGHRIGDDPIGYKCSKLETQRIGEHDICAVCLEILNKEPKRGSFAEKIICG